VETPHTAEILVIGDSLADWLAYGLEEVFADTPEIGIVRKIDPIPVSFAMKRIMMRSNGRRF
jgi:hypothetical protein